MTPSEAEQRTGDLPADVARVLDDFVGAARAAFGEDVVSITLFGSGAEGALRETSDVNVIVVLSAFKPEKAERLREALRIAQAAVKLSAMFVLREEVPAAAQAFAQKFADVQRRHRVLYGEDPFARLQVPRSSLITRLNQVLLNLTLRMRALYVERGLREEQLAAVVADLAGPIRTCAANLLELEGAASGSPKDALQRLTASLQEPGWDEVLANVSRAREGASLPPGIAGHTLVRLIELTQRMRERVTLLT